MVSAVVVEAGPLLVAAVEQLREEVEVEGLRQPYLPSVPCRKKSLLVVPMLCQNSQMVH
jgi:hypothetical protein